MRKWLILTLLAESLHAATIRGTVVENQTGHPLARATVLVEPVAGSPGTRMSARTNRFGTFEFAGVPAGAYLIEASRAAFDTAQWGQKRWNSSGTPLVVAESDTPFLTIRLPRFGSITGTVVDENEVGLPEFEVAAFLNTRPPQFAAKATSDDRGMYRIYGLQPGSYLVRSVAKIYDDGGYLPTFSRETDVLDQAYTVDVSLDQQTDLVNVRPLAGQLHSLTVEARPSDPRDMPVTMTLVSEMGRFTAQGPEHVFNGLPRGEYEIFAEAPTDTPPVRQGNYQKVTLSRDASVTMTLRRIPELTFQFDGVPLASASDGAVRVLGRRKDLAGAHATEVLTLVNNRVRLEPGPWEFALAPIPGYYVSGFSGPGNFRPTNLRFEGWNEATAGSYGSVRFTLASSAGSLSGAVTDDGNPVSGAPVFLEPIDLEPPLRVASSYVTLTDIHGRYRFDGLAPGQYRVLSSFEYRMPDPRTMVNAGARDLRIDERSNMTQDLDLYVIH